MKKENIVSLNMAEKMRCLKELRDIHFSVEQLYNWVQKDRLTEEMKERLLQLIEFHVADLSKILGFDSLSAQKVEEKYAEIRRANQRIRELEKQLGSKNPIEGLREQLKELTDLFRKWWDKEGFGYVREMYFTDYGTLEADLGFSFQKTNLFSDTPVSDEIAEQQWLESLKEKGYQLYTRKRSDDKELLDCPKNRELLTELLESRFPSLEIKKWESYKIYESEENLYEIRSVKVSIKDVRDLKALEEYLK
jgi:hypothetical protein